ncbi:hypothetical protein D3C80_2127480 [compost metagenome]
MLERFFFGRQLGRTGIHPALVVRTDTAGDHQAHTTPGTLGEVRGHALETAGLLLETRVHRAHQGAVAQRGKTQVQRG